MNSDTKWETTGGRKGRLVTNMAKILKQQTHNGFDDKESV